MGPTATATRTGARPQPLRTCPAAHRGGGGAGSRTSPERSPCPPSPSGGGGSGVPGAGHRPHPWGEGDLSCKAQVVRAVGADVVGVMRARRSVTSARRPCGAGWPTVSDAAVAALAAILEDLEILSRFDSAAARSARERRWRRRASWASTSSSCAPAWCRRTCCAAAATSRRPAGSPRTSSAGPPTTTRRSCSRAATSCWPRSSRSWATSRVALEHAVRAVDLLAEDAAPDSGSTTWPGWPTARPQRRPRRPGALRPGAAPGGGARRRRAPAAGPQQPGLLRDARGCFRGGARWSTQLQDLAAEHGVPLQLGRLDTVARALMGLGRLEDAEAAMLPGPAAGGAGRLRRRRRRCRLPAHPGRDPAPARPPGLAQADAGRVRPPVRAVRADLDPGARPPRAGRAARRRRRVPGGLRGAQAVLRGAADLQSAQRDARARALQAMFETTEARRQSRRYRELSLRDPLTGLYNRRYVDEQLPRLLGAPARRPRSSRSPCWTSTTSSASTTPARTRSATRSCAPSPSCCRTPAPPAARRPDGSFVARMGGEEFLLVLVGRRPRRRRRHLEDVRRAVPAHPWCELTGGLPVTVSIGRGRTAGAATHAPPSPRPRGRPAVPGQAERARPGRHRPRLTCTHAERAGPTCVGPALSASRAAGGGLPASAQTPAAMAAGSAAMQAGPLLFAHAAPDPVGLADRQRVLQAGVQDGATSADGLGSGLAPGPGRAPLAVGVEEERRALAPAGCRATASPRPRRRGWAVGGCQPLDLLGSGAPGGLPGHFRADARC